jgi:CheY-like chemotaxis protein
LTLPELPRVLLVERDPMHIEIVVEAIQATKPQSTVLEVRNYGEELDRELASHIAAGTLPSLVLLGLHEPVDEGLDVVARIRGNEKLRGVPIVIMTPVREPEVIERAYDIGANSVIARPTNPHAVREVVRQLASYWLSFSYLPVPPRAKP